MTKTKNPKHGTNARYQVHMRAGERPCDPCTDAHNTHMREWRATQLEAAGYRLKATHPGKPHSLRVYEHPTLGLKAIKA